jgi:hypothetical protein
MRILLSMVAMVFCCGQAAADSIDLSFNSDAVRVAYLHQFPSNKLNLDAGWLYNNDVGSVLHVGLHMADFATSGANPVTAGVGARLVYTDGDLSQQSGAAVPIGGYLKFSPQRFNRFSITGEIYYAPDVLSFGDAEKFEEYGVRFSYNVTREADIFFGARYVNAEYKKGPRALYDNGMNLGIQLRF